MADVLIWQGVFNGRIEDADYAIGVFERHNAAVREIVPAAQLLEVPVGAGWEPLCEHFKLETPAESYPRVNDTESFRGRFRLEDG